MGRHPIANSSNPGQTLDHVLRWVAYETGAGAGLLFISPLGKHVRYVIRLHFPASNNMAEYEALVNGLRIAVELGVRRLDARRPA
jgi:ribonuclease HI